MSNDLIARLRRLYVDTGMNYVQEAADAIESLTQHLNPLSNSQCGAALVHALIGDMEVLACARCKNKAWTVMYDGGEYPRLVCTACATDGGTFGWVSKE